MGGGGWRKQRKQFVEKFIVQKKFGGKFLKTNLYFFWGGEGVCGSENSCLGIINKFEKGRIKYLDIFFWGGMRGEGVGAYILGSGKGNKGGGGAIKQHTLAVCL